MYTLPSHCTTVHLMLTYSAKIIGDYFYSFCMSGFIHIDHYNIGLTPGVNYKVFVTAMNGVSLQAMPMTNISGLIIGNDLVGEVSPYRLI